jgi:uncharacterized protein (TIGR02145 family)
VPTDAEWSVLINYLDPSAAGGDNFNTAGGKMKSTGLQYWVSPNQDATNESGFSGLPAGYRSLIGTFSTFGYYGIWWSSTGSGPSSSWNRDVDYADGSADRLSNSKGDGFSVRCLRD